MNKAHTAGARCRRPFTEDEPGAAQGRAKMKELMQEVDAVGQSKMTPEGAQDVFWGAVRSVVLDEDREFDPQEVANAQALLGRTLRDVVEDIRAVDALAEQSDLQTAEVRHQSVLGRKEDADEKRRQAIVEHDRACRLLAEAENQARGQVAKTKRRRREAFDKLAELVRKGLPRWAVPGVLVDDLGAEMRLRNVASSKVAQAVGGQR